MPRSERLFILAEPRSGSSWLLETLNSHPDVCLGDELLNHVSYPQVLRFHGAGAGAYAECLDELAGRLPTGRRYSGCKVLLNQFSLVGPGFAEAFIDRFRRARFVFLIRRNLVAMQVSLALAHAHGVWHHRQDEPVRRRRVRVAPPVFSANILRDLQRREAVADRLAAFKVRCLELTYEEMFIDPRVALAGLVSFAGLGSAPLRLSRETKGNPFTAAEVVENHDELAAYLAAHHPQLARLLEEMNRAGAPPAGRP